MRAAALATAVLLAGEAPVGHLVEHSVYLMGTRATVQVWTANRQDGLSRIDAAIEALAGTERELSTWMPDSRLTALNRQPLHVPWHADAPLCTVLVAVADWHRTTNGTFDPAIGALLDAWDIHGEGRVPSARELDLARDVSGFRHLDLDPSGCTATRRRPVRIDPGAFGKGEALDRAARVLGGRPWMLDLGGQVAVEGKLPGEDGWPVDIAHPHDRSRAVLSITMRSGSLSTSGGSERDRFAAGRRISHHVDPRTGEPTSFVGSVTVWHPSGFVADVLSTALFVMGPAEGLSWAEARGFAACYLEADAAGRVTPTMTAAFRPLLAKD
jgi:thiamine biosynthesis lipoprotein